MLENVSQQMSKKAYSVTDAAAQISVSVPFVRQKIREGALGAKKIGARVVILDSSLESFLNKQEDWQPTSEKSGKNGE